jgi:hypothetical protein
VSGRQARADLDLEVNNDPLTKGDGTLTDSEDDRIQRRVRGNQESILFEDTTFPEPHASSIGDIVLTYTAASKTLRADYSIQRKAQFKDVQISIGVVDAITVQET